MKKKVIITLILLLSILFVFYKLVLEPVISNQNSIDNVTKVIEDSLKNTDSYKKIVIKTDEGTFLKEVQKYKNRDYYIVDKVDTDTTFVLETICTNNSLFTITNDGEYTQPVSIPCNDDFSLLDINLEGLVLGEYNDELVNFDFYDSYTVIYFDEDVYSKFDLKTMHPLLVKSSLNDFKIIINDNNKVTFEMKFSKDNEDIFVSLELENTRKLKTPKLED